MGLTEGLYDIEASYEIPVTSRDTLVRLWYHRADSDVEERPFDELDISSEERTYGIRAAAFQDIPKWRRCSCDVRGFIELFCGMRRVLGLLIRV